MAKTESRYAAPALERGLDILEALAAARTPLSQSELAKTLGRSVSEIFRMLALLEQRGYLLKDSVTGRYQLSLRLYGLAHAHSPFETLIRIASRPMEEFAMGVRESCHLGALSGGSLLVLSQVHGPGQVRLSIEPGSIFPALGTASGRLMAAFLKESEFEQAFPGESQAALFQIRDTGWVLASDESIHGVHDLAVPIAMPGGCVALTVSWLTPRGGEDQTPRLLPRLKQCAEEISRLCGF